VVLEECLAEAKRGDEHTRTRLEQMQTFFETMETWFKEFQTMEAPEVERAARMGSKVRRLLRLS